MRKTLIVLLAIGLLLVTSQAVLAFGLGEGRGMKEGICGGDGWFSALAPESQEKIMEIRETYREKIAALKEKMISLRAARDLEGLREAREEMAELKKQTREQIEPLLPAEIREKYGEMGPGKRSGFREKMRMHR